MKKTKGLLGRWLKNTVSIMLALVLLSATLLSITIGIYYYSEAKNSVETKAYAAQQSIEAYAARNEGDFYQACVDFTERRLPRDATALQFVDPNGKIIASSGETLSTARYAKTEDVLQAMETKEVASFRGTDEAADERVMSASAPVFDESGEAVGLLRYVMSLRQTDRKVILFCAVFYSVAIVLALVIYISGTYYVRSILEPISEITKTAKRIAGGSYGVQIKRQYDDEIGELADTINDMSNKISQNEKMQTEFVSSVSHELRTPLTAIGGWSETLLSGGATVDSADARRGLSIILRETKRLTGMVEELLEFTRMQDGRFTLNIAPGNIRSDFEDTVFMYGNRLKNENITLEYLDNDDDIPEISCDIPRMRQVYLNLLDNAAKHGGEGGKITAEIRREDSEVVIRIRDFGPGIPEDELPLVKKKFYKGTSKARGSGIGLAVCEEIVSMHNGTLTLSNAEGGGILVTIRLPIGEQ